MSSTTSFVSFAQPFHPRNSTVSTVTSAEEMVVKNKHRIATFDFTELFRRIFLAFDLEFSLLC